MLRIDRSAKKVAIEITSEMIRAGAEILEASSFCETSPTIAEGLAEDVLRSALAVARVSDTQAAIDFRNYLAEITQSKKRKPRVARSATPRPSAKRGPRS